MQKIRDNQAILLLLLCYILKTLSTRRRLYISSHHLKTVAI